MARPSALITDIDGTISRIVPRPEDAIVDPAIRAALEALARKLDLVAVITARDEATARRLVGAAGITYVGNYGLTQGSAPVDTEAIALARSLAATALEPIDCVTIEDKGVAFALHYRNCDDPDLVRARLLELVTPLAEGAGARVLEGKKVVELVPRDLPDKRNAFLKLVEANGIRGVVYLGDDLSDIVVFEEIASQTERGGIGGLGIAVVDAETDPSVRASAGLALDGVGEVVRLFEGLAARLGAGAADA
jgi:trehalose 6-phosphate phosphatase